jgi:hypothetical protein
MGKDVIQDEDIHDMLTQSWKGQGLIQNGLA